MNKSWLRLGFTPKFTRHSLTQVGQIFGLERRWLGLEPDFLFRYRVEARWRQEIAKAMWFDGEM